MKRVQTHVICLLTLLILCITPAVSGSIDRDSVSSFRPFAFSSIRFQTNRYLYCQNNPVNYLDPDGEWIESAWDAFSLGMGLAALSDNIAAGNWGSAALDAGGIILDTAALAVPLVPGGVSVGIKAGRMAGNVGDVAGVAKGLDKASEVSKTSKNAKRFSDEKQALVNMAKKDKQAGGINSADMDAYKNLNKELPDPFPSNKVRGPEMHPDRNFSDLHGHVGPVDHIPIK